MHFLSTQLPISSAWSSALGKFRLLQTKVSGSLGDDIPWALGGSACCLTFDHDAVRN